MEESGLQAQSGKEWWRAVLIGEYAHSLDAKGRVNFPSRLREHLGERFILTKGLDGCLFVYALDEWGQLEEKIKAMPMSRARSLQRFLFAGASDVEVDKQGRILIPPSLREYAGLEKDIMIIGASTRAEIWDKEKWRQSCDELTPELVAQAMEDLGF